MVDNSTKNHEKKEWEKQMKDYIVRATAANEMIRAFAVSSTGIVEEARQRHTTLPVITAALGRLLSAGAMMGAMMKGDDDIVTLGIRGDGPAQGLTVTADSHGNVKGYPFQPFVDIPRKYAGKLDVGGAIGNGTLTVSMDLGLKEPYSGQVELQTGEIGDDLAYYFTVSEQTPSAVGLGVMVDRDQHVKEAGGFIIQMMPDASEEVISAVEKSISRIDSVTSMLERGMSPEDILEEILGGLDLQITEKRDIRFHCNCSKEKVAFALATIDPKDIQEMIDDGETIEVKCHFCNKTYNFTIEDLKEIQKNNKKGE